MNENMSAIWVIASATSASHFPQLVNLIGSLHKYNLRQIWKIVIYDLGLTTEQRNYLQELAAVKVKDVPQFYHHALQGWTCKLWTIKDCAENETAGAFLYCNAGVQVQQDLTPIFELIQQNGYALWHAGSHLNRDWTTEYVYEGLEISQATDNTLQLLATVQGYSSRGIVKAKLIDTAFALASDERLLTPNSDCLNNRHDQPLFSLLIAKHHISLLEPHPWIVWENADNDAKKNAIIWLGHNIKLSINNGNIRHKMKHSIPGAVQTELHTAGELLSTKQAQNIAKAEEILFHLTAQEQTPEKAADTLKSSVVNSSFHKDLIFQSFFDWLVRNFGPKIIVETGSFMGWTTEFMAQNYPFITINTIESNIKFYDVSKKRLARYDNVQQFLLSSEQFLSRWLTTVSTENKCIFFLDAHWENYWPLPQEIRAISTTQRSAIIIVDDFKVPRHPEYGYDDYGEGKVCDFSAVIPSLNPDNSYHALLPNYADKAEAKSAEHLRGRLILFQNADDCFAAALNDQWIKQHFVDATSNFRPVVCFQPSEEVPSHPKIVALIPARNESRHIAFCLRAVAKFADAICVSDEASDDNTVQIVESLAAECRVERILKKQVWKFNETQRRQPLLDAGREIGGTHFIVFDADEAFTSNLAENDFLRGEILKLKPGERLELAWIQLWRSVEQFRYDTSVWTNNYKAFIFCDDKKCYYHEQTFHLERVPSNLYGSSYRIEGYKFGVLHFQFVQWRNLLIKQAWYRCLERTIYSHKSVQEINALYAPSKDETNLGLRNSLPEWFSGYDFFEQAIYDVPEQWREKQVLQLFEQYGREHFAELDIWDIDWGRGITKSHNSTTSTLKDIIHHSITADEYEMVRRVEHIGGWFSSAEILAIYRAVKSLPNNAKILEIGSYRGRSTNAIGYAMQGSARELYCLDIWRDFEQQGIRQSDPTAHLLPPTDYAIFEEFLRNTEWFSDQLRVLRGSTNQLQEILPQRFFDLILIDGAHDYENVFRDITVSLQCLKPGGIICGHDYHTGGGQDVIKAVHELIFSNQRFSEHGVFSGTTVWFARYSESDAAKIQPRSTTSLKVSAVVSTYNSEKFMRGCLQDLVEQTLYKKGELEIIVIDSASEQNEQAIVQEFQGRYSNIFYIRTLERETLYAAWNRGIQVARGHYITNANTDDRHRPDALEIMANYLDAHPETALVYANQLITTVANDTWATTQADRCWNWPPFSYSELERRCIIGPQPMWKKSLHEKYGYFRSEFTSAGDYEFWLRIGKTEDIVRLPEILGLYYDNPRGLEHGSVKGYHETHRIWDEYRIPQRGVIPGNSVPLLISPSELRALPYRTSVQPLVQQRVLTEAAPTSQVQGITIVDYPLVSIITPCTRPGFLPRALESIFDQTYQNFEILIVNDGGEDLKGVIEPFNDSRIRYYCHEEQRGPSAARNTAFRHARGKYIAYLDDDDFYYPYHLQTLVEFLEKSDYKIAYTDGYCSWQTNENGEWETYKQELVYSNQFDFNKLLIDNLFPICAFMHQRTCLFDAGFFDEALMVHEDWDLWIRMALKYPFQHIKKVTHEYTTRKSGEHLRTSWMGEFLSTFFVIHERYKTYANPCVQREQEEHCQKVVGWSISQITHATQEQLLQMKPEKATRRIVEASRVLNNRRDMESAHNIALLLVNHLQDNANLWVSLAKSLRFLGQHQSALNAVTRSLELQETPEGLSELIHTLKALGRTEDEAKSRQDFQLKFPEYAVSPEYPSAQKPLNVEPPPFEEFQDNQLTQTVPPIVPQQRIKRIQSDYENVWRVWRRDESLQWIAAELERRPAHYRCISFDFFDTLVARFCLEPVDLFVEVGRRLADLGLLKMPVSDEEYQNLRVAAENKARNLAFLTDSKVEISIAQIYAHLQYVVTEPERSAAIELQVEKERCYLNPCTTQLLQYARSRGLRIVVLSDTYYSADALCSILEFNGFNVNEIDLLLTSCDVGATKANGELFRVAVSRLGIQPSEMLHVGDNWEADYRDASQVGVKAFYYYRTTPYIHEVLQRERRIAGAWPALSSGLDSLRVLAQRLDGHIGRDKAYYRDGAFLLGPVMARFADWCVEQFREAGITRVLGLMREGEFLGKMLERAASARGIHLEVLPCYTSRKATYLASVGEATSLNLSLRRMQHTHHTVRKILELFGIRHGDIGDVLTQAELEMSLDSPEMFSKLEKIIGATSAAARSLVMKYLGPLVEGHSKIGIIDLGWHCTIQRHLVSILHQAGCPIRMLGCYLATHKYACDLVLNGAEVRAYLGNMGSRGVLTEVLMRSPELLEQTISACVGSTEGYRVNGNEEAEPVLGPLLTSEEECERKHLVQQGILAFQEIWLSVFNTKSIKALGASCITSGMLEEIDRYNLAILHRLVAFPTRQEAMRFGTFHHDDNLGSDPWRLICNDDALQALRTGGIFKLYQNSSTHWPQGIVAMERQEVVRQLSVGWRDPGVLGRLGTWPRHKGEFLPYSHSEKDVLEELLREHKPGLVLIFGQGNSAVRRWLLDTLSSLSASGADVKRAVIEAVRHPVSSSDGAVPHIYHRLLVGNFASEGFLAKVEKEIRHLPQAERVFLYLDHTCTQEEVERVLNTLVSRLGLGDLVVVGHGGNDTFELGEPQSAYMSVQRWFEGSGRSHGFLRVQNSIWPAELFTIFLKDSVVVSNATLPPLRLQDINLIVFPDWSGSEEALGWELAQVIKALATHPDKSHMALLIDSSNIAEEDADMMLSGLTMTLLMQEDLKLDEGPEISLIGQLSEIQWEALLPRLHARIVLENENQQAIVRARAANIQLYELDRAALPPLKLRDINLLVFPDWSQSEESLGWELQQVIKALATHPDKSHMALLIETSNIADEDAEIMLSAVIMNLLMQEDLEINEGPEISLVGQLSKIQWEALLPRLHARIVLENENQQMLAHAKVENIPFCQIDSIRISELCS